MSKMAMTGRKVTSKDKGRAMPNMISKRARSTRTYSSGSQSEDEGTGLEDKQAMLAALQAHGRAMFGSEGGIAESSAQAQRRAMSSSGDSEEDGDEDDNEEEEGFSSDDGWGAEDGFVTDSEDELQPEIQPVKGAPGALPSAQ
jgi:hypothetical protein